MLFILKSSLFGNLKNLRIFSSINFNFWSLNKKFNAFFIFFYPRVCHFMADCCCWFLESTKNGNASEKFAECRALKQLRQFFLILLRFLVTSYANLISLPFVFHFEKHLKIFLKSDLPEYVYDKASLRIQSTCNLMPVEVPFSTNICLSLNNKSVALASHQVSRVCFWPPRLVTTLNKRRWKFITTWI